jgi:hypothetical protein
MELRSVTVAVSGTAQCIYKMHTASQGFPESTFCCSIGELMSVWDSHAFSLLCCAVERCCQFGKSIMTIMTDCVKRHEKGLNNFCKMM